MFDADLIQIQLDALVRERARWEMFFARTGIDPLRLEYETLIADPCRAVHQIADLMGLNPPPNLDSSKITVEKQGDSLSLEWADRSRQMRGDPNILDIV